MVEFTFQDDDVLYGVNVTTKGQSYVENVDLAGEPDRRIQHRACPVPRYHLICRKLSATDLMAV